jgi:hypothetical protein
MQQRLQLFKHSSREEFGGPLKIWLAKGFEGLPRVQTEKITTFNLGY